MQTLLPHAERFEVPDSTHPMLQMNPTSIAERLAAFFSSHPMKRTNSRSGNQAAATVRGKGGK